MAVPTSAQCFHLSHVACIPHALNALPRELRFGLLKQRLLELVRRGETEEALNFAAERLAPESAGNPDMLRQVEEVVSLLAFEVRAPFTIIKCGQLTGCL